MSDRELLIKMLKYINCLIINSIQNQVETRKDQTREIYFSSIHLLVSPLIQTKHVANKQKENTTGKVDINVSTEFQKEKQTA